MGPRKRFRLRDVFYSTVEVEGVGPIKRIRVRALVLFLLIPMLVISACVLKYYGVF
jgi:hypothetical protein